MKAAARAELATRDGRVRELAAERNAALALAQQHAGQAQVRNQAPGIISSGCVLQLLWQCKGVYIWLAA